MSLASQRKKEKTLAPLDEMEIAGNSGELSFTVDLPNLFKELALNSANLKNIGPGAAYGFMIAMMKLNNIAVIAMRDNNTEILLLLEEMGVVGFEESV